MTRQGWTAGFALGAAMMLGPVAAQDNSASPQGDSYTSIAKLPDWQGNWVVDPPPGGGNPNDFLPELNLTPLYLQKREAMIAEAKRLGDDFNTNTKVCVPVGALRVMMRIGRIYEFLFTPGQITVIPQSNEVRRIYTNRASHPANVQPSFNGDSIAHWDGPTLVVDTVAIHPKAEFVNGRGLPVGDSNKDIQLIERITTTGDHMHIDSTATSKVALAAPYKWETGLTRKQFPILEEICTQNNLAIDPVSGKQTFPFALDGKIPGQH